MRVIAIPMLAVVLGTAFGAPAEAMVSDGSMLTNIATASFRAADNPVMQTASYAVTATVLVYNPGVQLRKTSSPTMQCSGGTVTFCIYVANTSAMSSAFNVIVEDILPGDQAGMGMAYVYGRSEWNPQGAGVVYGYRPYSITPVANVWNAEPVEGVVGTYYIRWAISVIGPNRSMMVCFKATVL